MLGTNKNPALEQRARRLERAVTEMAEVAAEVLRHDLVVMAKAQWVTDDTQCVLEHAKQVLEATAKMTQQASSALKKVSGKPPLTKDFIM